MEKRRTFLKLVVERAFKDYAWVRDLTVGFVVSAATVVLSVYFRLGAADDWRGHHLFLVCAVVLPYLLIVGGHIVWRLITGARDLHEELSRRLGQQVSITHPKDGDPLIRPIFFDGRRSIEGVESIELRNDGKATAYSIRFAPLKLKNRTVYFHRLSDSISPTDFEHFYADVGDTWGTDSKQHLIRAMSEEWASYDDHETRREIRVAARIDYEDDLGIRFECNFELLYHGGRGWNQPPDFKCIECRSISYRRIPLGVTPPE
jgi:hypothetical protein